MRYRIIERYRGCYIAQCRHWWSPWFIIDRRGATSLLGATCTVENAIVADRFKKRVVREWRVP